MSGKKPALQTVLLSDGVRVHVSTSCSCGRIEGSISGIDGLDAGDVISIMDLPHQPVFKVKAVLDGTAIVAGIA